MSKQLGACGDSRLSLVRYSYASVSLGGTLPHHADPTRAPLLPRLRFDGYASTVMARSVAHIRKYVVVGALLFARAMITLSGTVMPVETKTFDLADKAAAWAYLAEAVPATASS